MYTYLALGDSYTIGEQVPATDNFPNQTTRMLRASGIEVTDPVIIATTGWTTDELAASIREHNIRDTFSFVTLLIGVNNQYRGRSIENYEEEFLQLLNTAIAFAGNNSNSVFVLSIPDWGVTPFAADRDRAKVASEIDAYNASCRRIAISKCCHHLDITDSTRVHGNDADYLVADELHPSGKEYGIWAERLTKQIKEELTQ
jgi:lysophospholipase L1-like esterase